MAREKKLNVDRILRDFREHEESSAKRKDAFKIDSSFDKAMKKILKAKPELKKGKKRGRS